MKKPILTAAVLLSVFAITACSSGGGSQTFSEAHDAFETKLLKQESDQSEVPQPPAGVFDLSYYDSKIGPMAAYVSSDPGDGQKHPLMIWVAGGWSNDIGDFPWSYAEWENDQSAAAFREAGILMMYPSFRGANGNPGSYESLFGEVDDLISACEYAMSLPYVDSDRIYLGGHSTGGTLVLLASEYADNFRAVFSFGPADNFRSYTGTEFAFDKGNNNEYKLRSPINWLSDIKSPTFIIEGKDGNVSCLQNIDKKSDNENINCYIVDGAGHFSVLAPVNRLLAQKVAADTGAEVNITLTGEELQEAMRQTPVVSYPVMVPYRNEVIGFTMQMPAIWEEHDNSGEYIQYSYYSAYGDDNFWDSLLLYVDVYDLDSELLYEEFIDSINYDGNLYQGSKVEISGQTVYLAKGIVTDSSGDPFFNRIAAFQTADQFVEFWFYVPEKHQDLADIIIIDVIESIILE